MVVAIVVLSALGAATPTGAAVESAWPPVPRVDTTRVQPADFRDDELDLPFLLIHFHRLAEAVVAAGDNRGYIDIPVWRARQHNVPYNARIMESVLTLAWFYTAPRPWNPYHGSPAVRGRLEAALDFWCRSQSEDGRFSEYGPRQWNLAATAFATKFMGETLALLAEGPPIDRALLARVTAADRKAIEAVLTRPDLYEHGRVFSNQYTNVYAGGLAYLALHPDDDLRARLEARIRESSTDFQSPAGYFYEQKGPDYSYNLGTHQSNVRMALHHAAGTPLARVFIDETQRFFDWLAYNAVLEPGDAGFTLNRAIETRQQVGYLDPTRADMRGAPPREATSAYPFLSTEEDHAAWIVDERRRLEQAWPKLPELDLDRPTPLNPYAFLHRRHPRFRPTRAEREAAVARLPYLRSERFVHQRKDDREGLVFTYVRRPPYYAAFNAGPRLTEQQRFGLGLLWRKETGALLQSQTGSADAAWGTRADGAAQVYEAAGLDTHLRIGGVTVPPTTGAHDLEDGPTEVSYPLGEKGTKQVSFDEDSVRVSVRHAARFEEQIPLLVGEDDSIETTARAITVSRRGRPVLVLRTEGDSEADVRHLTTRIGGKQVVAVSIPARDRLEYTIAFP